MERLIDSGVDLDVLVPADDCVDARTMEKLPDVRMTALYAAVAQQEKVAA